MPGPAMKEQADGICIHFPIVRIRTEIVRIRGAGSHGFENIS